MKFKNILKIFKTDKRIKILQKFVNIKSKILEIGIHEGRFSELLLKKFKPEKLYLVDPWKYESDILYKKSWYGGNLSSFDGQKIQDTRYKNIRFKFKKQIDSGQIIVMRKKSDEVFMLLDDNFFDLIYIDGNHTFDYVKTDIINSLAKIKENGTIVCDDYDNSGWWNDGVTKAVNQLCEEKLIKKIFIKYNNCVLKKINKIN